MENTNYTDINGNECDKNGNVISDLFNHYDELPQKVKDIIHEFNKVGIWSYDTCKNLVISLEQIGYTCDYGLDAEPFNLKKL